MLCGGVVCSCAGAVFLGFYLCYDRSGLFRGWPLFPADGVHRLCIHPKNQSFERFFRGRRESAVVAGGNFAPCFGIQRGGFRRICGDCLRIRFCDLCLVGRFYRHRLFRGGVYVCAAVESFADRAADRVSNGVFGDALQRAGAAVDGVDGGVAEVIGCRREVGVDRDFVVWVYGVADLGRDSFVGDRFAGLYYDWRALGGFVYGFGAVYCADSGRGGVVCRGGDASGRDQ